MIKKLSNLLTRKPKLIIVISLALGLISIIGYLATPINYDILTYLPEDLPSTQGERLLEEPFQMAATSMLIVEGMPAGYSDDLIREIRDDDLCLLTERDMIWSEVTEDFLRQNDIPFLVKGRMGAGLAINVGPMFEKNRYYVPYAYLEKARDVIEAVFAEADMETDVSPDDGEEG